MKRDSEREEGDRINKMYVCHTHNDNILRLCVYFTFYIFRFICLPLLCVHCLIRHVNNCVMELLSVDAKNSLLLLLWQNCLCDKSENERQTKRTYMCCVCVCITQRAACLLYEILKIVLCVAFCWLIPMILLNVKLGTNIKQTQLEYSLLSIDMYHM